MTRSMGANKEVEKFARKARKMGWTVEVTKGNHIKWTPPGDGTPIFSGLTSCRSGVKKLTSQLRKAGIS